MSKYGTVEFSGKSGRLYSFNVYSLNTDFREYSAVYCLTKRTEVEDGSGSHEKVFFGITGNMSQGILEGANGCIKDHDANCVCAHREENEGARQEIMKDLIAHYHPPCNTN